MAKTRLPYAPEFRRQMVELVNAGRSPEELAREFEPTAQSIKTWVAQAARNTGDVGLTTTEREELSRLRHENRQLRLEREILSKAVRVRPIYIDRVRPTGFRIDSPVTASVLGGRRTTGAAQVQHSLLEHTSRQLFR